ncbi:MAG: hypothetical protein QOE70_1339 [Chthoniobacter sp.]|jgi:PAS domain S-box-containing protein|nr:hypothetical protein [Chthoniobacter sp.]
MRILVLAPTSNDARLTVQFLGKAGLEATICADLPELCARLDDGCGAVLLAEEALGKESVRLLVARLEIQPSWSDLPIVMITGAGEAQVRGHHLAAFGPVGNVSLIERPVRPGTLVSTLEVAMRSRRRQYQVRALLEERQEMTAKTQQQARIFDTTLSSIADFAYIFDRSGRFLYANKSLLDLWGLGLADVVGKNFFELPYPTELATRLQEQIQQVFATGQVLRDETSYTNPAGLTGYYEYIFSPVLANDGTVEVVARSTRDTSERRRSEEALRAADRRKDEFLAMLAHELRNPLASVSSAATLLKNSGDPVNHAWAAGVIERQTGQLAHLIDDLLDVSRITTGKIRLRKEIVDAAAILDRACESARPLITERGHELVCHYPRGGLWLEADPTRVEQIILNLLTNAAKYTPAGGRINLSARREGGELVMTVRDNGIGIAPQRLPEMFQLFAQGERSIARSEGGLGIGLTIVQKLAEMHGGRVDGQSDGPNLGSTFTIRLPAAAAPIPSNGKGPARAEQNGKGLRVLIVDDNADTAQALARLLARIGHQIVLAHDGAQALERAREQAPQAILLDIGLPGMDGFEVAQRLRGEPSCSGALIIAVTGYGQDEDRQRALDAGFDHHLVKPVDLDELKRLLRDRI